jgi:ABC-2 type transport system ATP-binding protein
MPDLSRVSTFFYIFDLPGLTLNVERIMSLFEAHDVTKRFATQTALDNVSISVPEQSIFGLLGPNGAGKTTLIRIINQITAPDSGTLLLNGRNIKPDDVYQIGYLPEERGLYKKMKVGEQALYFARLKGLSRTEAMRRLKYWFRKLEITDWWGKRVDELSKGMQQKVQFVTTVLHEPRLIIFDEPFTGFDPINVKQIKNEILFLRERGATIIFSTHNMASVEELCDNITLINKAKTILEGSVEKIRHDWSENEYDVVFAGEVTPSGNNHFSVISSEFSEGMSTVRIKASGTEDTNEIIRAMTAAGTITSFNPALPSMNDIFIKVVESKNKEAANN